MRTLYTIWRKLKNKFIRWAIAHDENQRRRQADRLELEQELRCVGYEIDGSPYNNPFRGIGSALQLAADYGIELYRGTCHGDCRAHLPRWCWRYPLRADVDPWIIHPWYRREWTPETVIGLDCWGTSIAEAVAKIMINGRRAGVI